MLPGSSVEVFSDESQNPGVRGFLHRPAQSANAGLVLTHGAGSNSRAPLLQAIAEAFTGAGFTVLRCDLPFRQAKSFGPPRPGGADLDREGLKNALHTLRKIVSGRMFLGGHSYGGRQATMLCAAEHGLVNGLLLFSYPLHSPAKPQQLRIQHLPDLQTDSLFVHGTRDGFGSIEEMEAALKLIAARKELVPVDNAGHDLGFKAKSVRAELPAAVLAAFQKFFP